VLNTSPTEILAHVPYADFLAPPDSSSKYHLLAVSEEEANLIYDYFEFLDENRDFDIIRAATMEYKHRNLRDRYNALVDKYNLLRRQTLPRRAQHCTPTGTAASRLPVRNFTEPIIDITAAMHTACTPAIVDLTAPPAPSTTVTPLPTLSISFPHFLDSPASSSTQLPPSFSIPQSPVFSPHPSSHATCVRLLDNREIFEKVSTMF
jgi:hypothetical protein